MQNRLHLLFLVFACLWGIGCAPTVDEPNGVNVWVSLLPQQSIVERIVGDRGEVEVMVRPGQSPETYSPSVPQMVALAKADVYFGIGMPLERKILAKIEHSMSRVRFVQTAELSHDTGGHHHHDGHIHGDKDPHVWLDPQWMLGFVTEVRDALITLDPEGGEFYMTNAAAVSAQLNDLDISLAKQLEPYKGRSFYINHPSLGHFAARYHIVQRPIEHSGTAPSARKVADLVQSAKAERVGAIFTQPEFGGSSADVLARALDVELVEVDALSADYFNNMLSIAQRLSESFAHE